MSSWCSVPAISRHNGSVRAMTAGNHSTAAWPRGSSGPARLTCSGATLREEGASQEGVMSLASPRDLTISAGRLYSPSWTFFDSSMTLLEPSSSLFATAKVPLNSSSGEKFSHATLLFCFLHSAPGKYTRSVTHQHLASCLWQIAALPHGVSGLERGRAERITGSGVTICYNQETHDHDTSKDDSSFATDARSKIQRYLA